MTIGITMRAVLTEAYLAGETGVDYPVGMAKRQSALRLVNRGLLESRRSGGKSRFVITRRGGERLAEIRAAAGWTPLDPPTEKSAPNTR